MLLVTLIIFVLLMILKVVDIAFERLNKKLIKRYHQLDQTWSNSNDDTL